MAWPKKGTRKLVIDGEPFLWHFPGHCLFCCEEPLTVGQAGKPFVLYVDTIAPGFEFRPGSVVDAVRWAYAQGWSTDVGPNRFMAYNERRQDFQWLPEGQRYLDLEPLAESGASPSSN